MSSRAIVAGCGQFGKTAPIKSNMAKLPLTTICQESPSAGKPSRLRIALGTPSPFIIRRRVGLRINLRSPSSLLERGGPVLAGQFIENRSQGAQVHARQ